MMLALVSIFFGESLKSVAFSQDLEQKAIRP